MRALSALLMLCAVAISMPAVARSHHAHYGYQGGHYVGGHGSSHKGGHYRNARTHNHYTHHRS